MRNRLIQWLTNWNPRRQLAAALSTGDHKAWVLTYYFIGEVGGPAAADDAMQHCIHSPSNIVQKNASYFAEHGLKRTA